MRKHKIKTRRYTTKRDATGTQRGAITTWPELRRWKSIEAVHDHVGLQFIPIYSRRADSRNCKGRCVLVAA